MYLDYEIQDKELYKIYKSCKYEYWVAYLYLFTLHMLYKDFI